MKILWFTQYIQEIKKKLLLWYKNLSSERREMSVKLLLKFADEVAMAIPDDQKHGLLEPVQLCQKHR